MSANQQPSRAEFAARLREESMAVRLSCSQFGRSRKVSTEQKDQMAGLFDAESDRVSASKKLLDTRHEAYLAVTGLIGRAKEAWKHATLPYPEPGLRLIRRSAVEQFNENLRLLKMQLAAAVSSLEQVYQDLLADSRLKLGGLFNASDYPMTLVGEFDIDWSFQSVDPPEYLRNISPKLYEAEQERVKARFAEAVALAEQAFQEEFAKTVQHLVERLTPQPDGKQKKFNESAMSNLTEFFDRFSALNLGSNPDLDLLVEQAKSAVKGVTVDGLRKDVTVRDTVRGAMAALSQQLDAMQIDKPKRKIRLGDDEHAADNSEAA